MMRVRSAPGNWGLFLKTLHLWANFHTFEHLALTCLKIKQYREEEGYHGVFVKHLNTLDHLLSKQPHTVRAQDIHKAFCLFRQAHKRYWVCPQTSPTQLGKFEVISKQDLLCHNTVRAHIVS